MTDHGTQETRKPPTKQIVMAAAVQLAITLGAFWLLKKTPDDRIRGPRWLWRLLLPATVTHIKGPDVILAPIGPVLFLTVGRRWGS